MNPNPVAASNGMHSDGDAPEIRKYKKKFSGDVSSPCCRYINQSPLCYCFCLVSIHYNFNPVFSTLFKVTSSHFFSSAGGCIL